MGLWVCITVGMHCGGGRYGGVCNAGSLVHFVLLEDGLPLGVDKSCGEDDLSAETALVKCLQLVQFLQVQGVEVPDEAEAHHEQQQRGHCVPTLRLTYFRISAFTAGECLSPILLPYNSSSVYPSNSRADSLSNRKGSSSPDSSLGALGRRAATYFEKALCSTRRTNITIDYQRTSLRPSPPIFLTRRYRETMM